MTATPRARVAVRAARIFDGAGWLDVPTTVFVDDGKISIVDGTGAALPDDVTLHDLGPDATLLPGLIDSHTHLAFDATPDVVAHVRDTGSDELLQTMRGTALRMLRCGITTIRDVGDRDFLSLSVREETAGLPAAGPRIVAAGPPLTPSRGHCWFLGGEADGIVGLRRAIDEHVERGVDLVKVMTTGGRMTKTTLPHESQYTRDELSAAATRAHEHGLPVAGHAHGTQGIVDALHAGFDTLEHVSFMTGGIPEFAPDQAVIDAIAARGTICSVTAGVLPGVPVPAPLAANLPAIGAHVKNLHDSGCIVALGPDGGVSPPKAHHVLPYAIADLVAAGMDVTAVLTAATAHGARACALDGRIGRIAVGYEADLLAVAADPRTDVAVLQTPLAVYRRGMRVV